MSYTFKVNITQEIIDRPGVNPNDRDACLDYLAPLMDLSNLRQGFYKDKGEWENSWRSVAEPFSYDLELPDEVQPVSKV